MALVSFTSVVNYPDVRATEFRDILAPYWGWTPTVDNGNGSQIPNPISKNQFITAYIQKVQDEHLKELIKNAFRDGKEKSQIASNTIELT